MTTHGPLVDGDLEVLDAFVRGGPSGVDMGFLQWECQATTGSIERLAGFLRTRGCDIEPMGPNRYRLSHAGLEVWQDYLAYTLAKEGVRRKVLVYRQTPSTQDIARQQSDTPVAVLTDHQTAGRGRLGRQWLAPPGTGGRSRSSGPMI